MGVNSSHSCECSECEERGRELERLRAVLRSCQHGPDVVDIGEGEAVYLYLPNKSDSK